MFQDRIFHNPKNDKSNPFITFRINRNSISNPRTMSADSRETPFRSNFKRRANCTLRRLFAENDNSTMLNAQCITSSMVQKDSIFEIRHHCIKNFMDSSKTRNYRKYTALPLIVNIAIFNIKSETTCMFPHTTRFSLRTTHKDKIIITTIYFIYLLVK